MKRLSIILLLLVLVPVQAQENGSTSSTIDAGNETTTTYHFENQEEMREKATDILQTIIDIMKDILEYIRATLANMPLME